MHPVRDKNKINVQASRYECHCVSKINILISQQKIFIGTQKNPLNETVLLSTQI